MKEATGELNTTFIVVISVAILSAFFFGVLWPQLNNNFKRESQCKQALCDCSDTARTNRDGIEYCSCTIKGDTSGDKIECVYKG